MTNDSNASTANAFSADWCTCKHHRTFHAVKFGMSYYICKGRYFNGDCEVACECHEFTPDTNEGYT